MSITDYAKSAFQRYWDEMNQHYAVGHIKDAKDAADRAWFFWGIVLLSTADARFGRTDS